ncbi:MAG: MBL fold metallo-hydrolase [Lachnospiraceae bacterium]|nr:MBL fold metallo-hydrolase [Lachnospiraceae bacterium]
MTTPVRIINLIENTEGAPGCTAAHGLCFYVKTPGHRLLSDLGPSADTLANAQHLGIDLTQVDTVVLSHGHYDHSGGILPFTRINDSAHIYMQDFADGAYYSDDGPEKGFRYIGIDPQIAALPQLVRVQGDLDLDDELSLLTVRERIVPIPSTNRKLMRRQGDAYVPDDFRHEQMLVIRAGGKHILISGCAHNGILNILSAYEAKYGSAPDVVISGFHLMKREEYTEEERQEIAAIALKLKQYSTTFYTCHCTGVPAYEQMKAILGGQLHYVHCGEEICL